MKTTGSDKLFEHALRYIPGGVNSPVRAFRSVGRNPLFVDHAEGSKLWDVDGNVYVDCIGSWGPMILGHGHPRVLAAVINAARRGFSFGAPTELEVTMADLIGTMVPSMEMVRMVNSGTEATMSAVRLARAFTGREKIIKFEGCYHGHGDSFLIRAGSGAMTLGVPDSPGVLQGVAAGTLTARFNDLDSVRELAASHKDKIAALIVEPVVGNMGCVPPGPGFLAGLRKLCTTENIILIFDEVMTGFRLAPGGAQELYGIRPDLTTLGKIIGGGLPVGAYGGRREIMEMVAPSGPMYQAGTLSGNPLAMTAGHETLSILREDPGVYGRLEQAGARLEREFRRHAEAVGIPVTVNRVGSMLTVFFSAGPVTDFGSAAKADTQRFARYFREMLDQGIYLPPSQFEAAFLSTAHTEDDLLRIEEAHRRSLEVVAAP
jgi:glutamate-1-semialdehyde 2,1-aminomutase